MVSPQTQVLTLYFWNFYLMFIFKTFYTVYTFLYILLSIISIIHVLLYECMTLPITILPITVFIFPEIKPGMARNKIWYCDKKINDTQFSFHSCILRILSYHLKVLMIKGNSNCLKVAI